MTHQELMVRLSLECIENGLEELCKHGNEQRVKMGLDRDKLCELINLCRFGQHALKHSPKTEIQSPVPVVSPQRPNETDFGYLKRIADTVEERPDGWKRAFKCGPDVWHKKGVGFRLTKDLPPLPPTNPNEPSPESK